MVDYLNKGALLDFWPLYFHNKMAAKATKKINLVLRARPTHVLQFSIIFIFLILQNSCKSANFE